jgi:hypothetical protein
MIEMTALLETTYGVPNKTKSTVQNSSGIDLEKEIFIWEDKQGNRITVESIDGSSDASSLLLESVVAVTAKATEEK